MRHHTRLLLPLMATLFLLAAAYTVLGVGMDMSALEMTAMAKMRDMPSARAAGDWSAAYWVLVFLMWWVMMVAMMLPSVAPTVLLHAALHQHRHQQNHSAKTAPQAGAFLGGYLLAWGGFSAIATGLQWGLEATGLVSPSMMILIDTRAGAVVLILAGLYQFTPLKTACLRHCRSPADFLTRRGRLGAFGAFVMGGEHGAICLGCCWALMALLFAGGIMNLWWICALLTLVVAEKHLSRGELFARGVGAGLVVWGLWQLISVG
ncbi:DUF2182 domain-containing protein [Tritonibacter multivorans]|uniref:DUF2182 domain-containing protein n=1 Tax=Tritonibacter multivorans TaxID=928856 RepID=UPI000B0DD4F3|nr:DUF2182 domain-containing protein [Tritonibacter multivorans]MDA7421823.1 DUF2182 domain-containing protein [Tritonibacter multivorans]